MAVLISLSLFFVLTTAISLYGYRRYARPGRIYEQLGAPVIAGTETFGLADLSGSAPVVRIIQRIGEKLPISPDDAGTARRYLMAAGYRSDSAVGFYYGIKVIFCLTLFLLVLVLHNRITSNSVLGIVMVVGAAVAGYFGPNMVLEHLVGKRHERLRLSLPDALDLLVVCVEAGLGLDQAVLNVSRELKMTHKDISDELGLVTLAMRAGTRRAEALRHLADRTGEVEIRKLVAVLIQTDRFGTSIAESLRTHSDFMRMRRKQEAEERAGKVGVKLVFPIFFLILPSMLVVAAGPGLLQIFKYLFPMMRQF